MRRSFGAAVAVGLIVLLVVVLRGSLDTTQSLHVPAYDPVAGLAPGQRACQERVPVDRAFTGVRFTPDVAPFGDFALGGPTLAVVVRRTGDRRVLARGRLRRGTSRGGPREVALPPVPAGGPVDVCFLSLGPGRVALYGRRSEVELSRDPYDAGRITTLSDLRLDGRRLPGDLSLELLDPDGRRRSAFAALAVKLQRASHFKADGVTPVTLWALLALLLTAVPVLLVRALGALEDDPRD